MEGEGSSSGSTAAPMDQGGGLGPAPGSLSLQGTGNGGRSGEEAANCQVGLAVAAVVSIGNSKTNRSEFSAVNVEAAAALNCLSSYNEIVGKLNRLWDDQITVINNVDDSHWKNPEFPLARIKKIMRMDEEVKMISSEVPVMLSKAVEIFVMELSLRAWLHTEESKRRTVQRSDIAMAITKQDMFDFLIDIVPREEIQLKSKTQSKTESDSLQMLTPELLQVYLQHLSQQQQQQQQQTVPSTSTSSTKLTAPTLQQQQQQQQQQHQQHLPSTSSLPTQLLPHKQQTPQQQCSQQQQQQQQQQVVDSLGDVDEASAKIFQDNVALLQQLQQLVQLQMQVQQLQDATSSTTNTSTGGGGVGGGGGGGGGGRKEVEHAMEDVSSTTATDNIHHVTINAANDILTDTELQSAITSLSNEQPGGLHLPSSSLSSSSSFDLLSSSTSTSSSLVRPQTVLSVPMVIEPELVEPGALGNSPSSVHGLLDDTVSSGTSQLLLGRGSSGSLNTRTITTANSQGLTLSAASVRSIDNHSIIAQNLGHSTLGGGGVGGGSSNTPLREFRQLDQLDPQMSNILVQTGTEPEHYVIQTTPLLELSASNTAHTVTINPSGGGTISDPSVPNLGVIAQNNAGVPVTRDRGELGRRLVIPNSATLESSPQDPTYLTSLATSTDSLMDT